MNGKVGVTTAKVNVQTGSNQPFTRPPCVEAQIPESLDLIESNWWMGENAETQWSTLQNGAQSTL